MPFCAATAWYNEVLPFVMNAGELIEALYRNCLGRFPDPSGMATFTELLRTTGDPTLVLQTILNSEEYAVRSQTGVDCTAEVNRARSGIQRRLRVVDVGAQSLGIGSHPYDPLDALCDLEIIGFDPLQERLRERAEMERSSHLQLLPYAVGDGGTHTLYINNDDATSSLFPLNTSHNSRFNHLSDLRTVRTEQIKTHRLDDVLPEGPVDFLKLDIQGAELMALQGAEQTLSRTAVIHCEVEFSPIYLGQPLFPAVYQHLAARGFSFVDFIDPGRYHYLTPSGRQAPDRLLWADAVFFRETDDVETRRVQAIVAAGIYKKPTLAEYLLEPPRAAG